MTAAQVAKLSELTGHWSEPLPERVRGLCLADDGRLVPHDGQFPSDPTVLTVLTGNGDPPRGSVTAVPVGQYLNHELFI